MNFIPIFDSFKGLKNPLQLFLSRENNLVPFSLLDNETSNHTVVLADSGSGKSAFIIDAVLAAKRMHPEPLVFVIDKKSSYTMAAEYFDGDFIKFGKSESPFSPFHGEYDDEKFVFLTQLLNSAIKLTSKSADLQSIHQAAISKALRSAYARKEEEKNLSYIEGRLVKKGMGTNTELTMDDVVAELGRLPAEKEFETSSNVIEDLVKWLMPFYGTGIYANHFKGSDKKRSKVKSFCIYDLDALDSDEILQSLMTMAVFEEIRQVIKRDENKGRTGFIVFEEIGMLGRDNPTAKRFIIDFAETARKLGMWLISLTPRPQNYFELEAGSAMWGVADNFIFLQMSPDNVDYVAKNSTLLDEATKEIVKSLRTRRGEFAEVFYLDKKKTKAGSFRYVQTEYDRWLAPTNAKDTQAAETALRRFQDHRWQALEFLAKTYPKGVETKEAAGAPS